MRIYYNIIISSFLIYTQMGEFQGLPYFINLNSSQHPIYDKILQYHSGIIFLVFLLNTLYIGIYIFTMSGIFFLRQGIQKKLIYIGNSQKEYYLFTYCCIYSNKISPSDLVGLIENNQVQNNQFKNDENGKLDYFSLSWIIFGLIITCLYTYMREIYIQYIYLFLLWEVVDDELVYRIFM